MISAKVVVVVLCISLGSRGDGIQDVDRVLQNLALQSSLPQGSGDAFDLEQFLNHAGQFKEFVIEHDKSYESDSEIEKRFDIFRENLRDIEYFQRNELGTATYGVNRFADQTAEEFKMGLSPINWNEIQEKFTDSTFEEYTSSGYGVGNSTAKRINYKEKGKILEKVQDQHMCGSCWAHSAVACLESAHAIKHNKLVELSKQQLVDCDFLDDGCCGGWPFYAYEYIKYVGGIMEEKDYRQRIYEGPCKFDQKKAHVNLSKYYMLYTPNQPGINEQKYEKFLNDVGPLVAVINGNGFRFYRGGVMNQPSVLCSKSPRSLNHAVLNVGYDVEVINGESFPYWIIKNSWGASWGENGYIRVSKGTNTCGVGWIASGVVAV